MRGGPVSAGSICGAATTACELDDGMTAPARVSQPDPGVLRITIHEGRNRQVRRMCEAVGHPVTRLVRTRIGPLIDRSLRPGQWRELTTDEWRALTEAVAESRSAPVRIDTIEAVSDAHPARRANVIGLGLIGGSVALGASRAGLARER